MKKDQLFVMLLPPAITALGYLSSRGLAALLYQPSFKLPSNHDIGIGLILCLLVMLMCWGVGRLFIALLPPEMKPMYGPICNGSIFAVGSMILAVICGSLGGTPPLMVYGIGALSIASMAIATHILNRSAQRWQI